jgi:predicted O-methyltransferase YrrM
MSLLLNSVVINRDDRPQRLETFRRHFGESPLRLPAVVPADLEVPKHTQEQGFAGWYAGMHSHKNALRHAEAEGWPFVTIFEDDAVPSPFYQWQVERFMGYLPFGVDIINFGGYHRALPKHIEGPVFRLREHSWLECYRVYAKAIPVVLRAFETAIRDGDWFDYGSVWHFLQHTLFCVGPLNGIVHQDRDQISDQTGKKAWWRDSYSPVPGWFSEKEGRAYQQAVYEYKVKELAEVGVYCGRSLSYVADAVLSWGGHITLVDLWEKSGTRLKTSWERPEKRGRMEKSRKDFEWHLWKMGLWKKNIHILQMDSWEAAGKVVDEQLDAVFIDAAHDYESVKGDLERWVPKVRKGGIVCGHDYTKGWPGVVNAVNERFGKPDRVVDTFWCVEVK